MEFIILPVALVLLFWLMSRSTRKMQQQQIEQRNEALVVGNNVVTQAGFLGRIVDIDGDAVTLESPSGDESVWLRSSIVTKMDIPLGESEYVDGDTDEGEEPESDELTNESPFIEDKETPTENK
ncbi:preprotein translocase subunit YajC [Trueperella bialowiezensis]|uniref:Preprotein translocase subunit YajC n=1 Tax=Trueperella bialowiezensis TaxID=312285 RepID=A0A448PBX5_9ACTO|nr:preprotein translocase subunit YajC [Trueperella bialowiezensis]VEI12479.1 preprotein translocase subunit YajC [Trueperella bialowiezensis]